MGGGIACRFRIVLCRFPGCTMCAVCSVSGSGGMLSVMPEKIPGPYCKQDEEGEREQYFGATCCDVFRIVVA
jgi:hypothetical protein